MQEFVFGTLTIESRKDNMIAFTLSVSLLKGIFAAARAIDSETMEVCGEYGRGA